MTPTIKLTLAKIRKAGSIAAAIEAYCEEHYSIASGIIGPSFACSGPGSGWQRNFGVNDYASRALSDEFGARYYVDSEDGRCAELDDEDVVWSEESIVELEAPDEDEIETDRETVEMMIEALDSGHCIEGPGDWDEMRALVEVSED